MTTEREARCAIESYCQRVTGGAGGGWYDTVNHDPDTTEEVAEAVRYLELRGLLERQDHAPQTVRVKEES